MTTKNNIMGGGASLPSGTENPSLVVRSSYPPLYGTTNWSEGVSGTVDPNGPLPEWAPGAIFPDIKTVNLINPEEEEFKCSSIGE